MLPSIEDILKLRKNLQTMRILCDHFLPCVIGKKRWKMQILSGRHVNDITTVSDEAFVLLVLENIWDDMIKVNIDEYYRPKKGKKPRRMKKVPGVAIHPMHPQTTKINMMIEVLLLENGLVCGVDLVDTEDGTQKESTISTDS